jgi:transposase
MSGAWLRGPANAMPPSANSWQPSIPSAPSAVRSAWIATLCGGSPANPTWPSCWSRPPAGKPGSIRSNPWINQRWNEGITDAAALHAELQGRGWKGSVQAVRRYVRPFRQLAAAPPPHPPVPKARQITRWLLSRPASLDPGEHTQLAAIRAHCPHINALAAHVTSFAEMMTSRTGDRQLEGWLTAVEADDQPHLHSFTAGIRRDQDAVTAGLTLPHSSGAVEGNVNRIKMLKRQMYGRALFGLLHPG